MTTIDYLISNNFPNGYNLNILSDDVNYIFKTSPILQYIINDENKITLYFTDSLSTDNISLLNNIIQNHIPNSNLYTSKLNINICSKLKYYYKFSSIYINGEKEQKIKKIKIISYMQTGGISYSLKIIDKFNNNIITEQTYNNTIEQINEFTTLMNLPYENTIFEILIKSNTIEQNIYIKSIIIEYN